MHLLLIVWGVCVCVFVICWMYDLLNVCANFLLVVCVCVCVCSWVAGCDKYIRICYSFICVCVHVPVTCYRLLYQYVWVCYRLCCVACFFVSCWLLLVCTNLLLIACVYKTHTHRMCAWEHKLWQQKKESPSRWHNWPHKHIWINTLT